jgi:ABC-type glycerol-3-phosphate transport system substrate-binding protein
MKGKNILTPRARAFGPTRRSVLKGAGAAALAAAAGPAIHVRAEDAVNLNILLTNIPWTDAVLTTVAEAYKEHTGGRVTITGEQTSYEAHYEKLVLELSSSSSTFDIVTTDTIWIRQLVNNSWVKGLEPMKAEDPSLPDLNWKDFLDGPYIFSTFDGQRWALHSTQSTPVFVYRKDLLEEAGIAPPPLWNWDQYRDAAKALTKNGVSGATMLLGGQDAAMGDWMFRVMGYDPNPPGNDFILDDDANPIFNENQRGERAIERMKEVLQYCPEGVFNFDYPDGAPLLQEGKVAMVVHWLDMWPGLEDPAISKFPGKFGYTVAPTDNVSQHMVAGWGMFISAFSEHPREAYEFMAWMLEGKAYQLFREAGETTLIYKPDLENAEVQKALPLLNVYTDMAKLGTTYTAYPPYKVTNAAEVQRLVFEEVVAGVSGEKTAAQAMKDAEDRVVQALRA